MSIKTLWANFLNKRKIKYRKKHKISKLKNPNYTMISNNCTAGCIYNHLSLQFLSPTINLKFADDDFLTFIYNLKEFVEKGELTEVEGANKPYPVGKLSAPCGSVIINFIHYDNFQYCMDKWKERCARINWDNMCFLYNAEETTTKEHIKKFEEFPNKNKAIIGMDLDIDSPIYFKIVSGKINNPEDGIIFHYKSKNSPKRWLDEYDYVSLINSIKENN